MIRINILFSLELLSFFFFTDLEMIFHKKILKYSIRKKCALCNIDQIMLRYTYKYIEKKTGRKAPTLLS